MRKILFVARTSDVESARHTQMTTFFDKFPNGTLRIGSITKHTGLSDAVLKFQNGQLDLLIIPRPFVTGWSVRGDDIEVEFSEDYPEGDGRIQAEGRVRQTPTI